MNFLNPASRLIWIRIEFPVFRSTMVLCLRKGGLLSQSLASHVLTAITGVPASPYLPALEYHAIENSSTCGCRVYHRNGAFETASDNQSQFFQDNRVQRDIERANKRAQHVQYTQPRTESPICDRSIRFLAGRTASP